MANPKKAERAPEPYESYGTLCLTLASVAADRETRVLLREMAAEWFKLASAKP